MDEQASKDDNGNPNQGRTESSFSAVKRELENDKPVDKENQTTPTGQNTDPPQPLWRIWMVLCGWWDSMKKVDVSNRAISIATIVIAGATIVYMIFAIKQWQAMNESNEINRDSLQSVQRAYISFQSIRANTITERLGASGEAMSFQFFAETLNTGNTPARGRAQYFAVEELPSDPTQEQFKGHPTGISEAINSKAPHVFGGVRKPMSLFGLEKFKTTGTVRTHIVNQKFFFWGWITYRDEFPNTEVHLTEFCQLLTVIGANPRLSPNLRPEWDFQFQACEHHNCADGECGDYKNFAAFRPPN